MPSLSISAVRKVLRWAVMMNLYNYVCIYIPGQDNVWADLLGRWSAGPSCIRRLINIPVLSSSNGLEFDWTKIEELAELQRKYVANKPPTVELSTETFCTKDGAYWIPDEAEDFQVRVCIAAHTGAGGHRGAASTTTAVKKIFWWSTMSEDIRTFVQKCIHCMSTTGGKKVPSPLGEALHGTKSNDLLQFDYLKVGCSNTGEKYVLLMRDGFSGY